MMVPANAVDDCSRTIIKITRRAMSRIVRILVLSRSAGVRGSLTQSPIDKPLCEWCRHSIPVATGRLERLAHKTGPVSTTIR
jgi:hypothetical protein